MRKGWRWVRWWVPDLSALVAIVTLFYCLFVFDGCQKLFRDSDTGWHIRTGEAILASGTLPRADPYSFSRGGAPWVAWEWGADVLMGWAHRVDGLRGVAWLYALAIAACSWLWVRLHWAAGGDFFLACLMASLMLSTVNLHWLARPHVFSWLLLLAGILWAERAPARFRWWHGVAAAAGSAAWANLHASFLMAPGLALVYAVSHLLRPLLWDLDRVSELSKARWFLAAALSAAAGTLLNPYGYGLHRHVFGYLADSELLARIGEFQSFNFHSDGAFQILVTVGLAGVGGVVALGQKKLAHFLLAVLLIATALRSARGLPLVALLLLPLAGGAITGALRGARGLAPGLRAALDGCLNYSARLRAIDMRLSGAALMAAAALIALVTLGAPAAAARAGFPADQFPVAAAAAVEKLPADARILAPDKFGGYLIYRCGGRRKVFFDGRSDFYGSGFMKDYIHLMEVRPGWRSQVASWRFSHALLPVNSSLAEALAGVGWRVLYRDSVAVLLAEQPEGSVRVNNRIR